MPPIAVIAPGPAIPPAPPRGAGSPTSGSVPPRRHGPADRCRRTRPTTAAIAGPAPPTRGDRDERCDLTGVDARHGRRTRRPAPGSAPWATPTRKLACPHLWARFAPAPATYPGRRPRSRVVAASSDSATGATASEVRQRGDRETGECGEGSTGPNISCPTPNAPIVTSPYRRAAGHGSRCRSAG